MDRGNAGPEHEQWLVLDALEVLIRETEDAVSHSDVAAQLQLDRAAIGMVMKSLEHKHLVSHGDAYMSRAWRVILTPKSRALLAEQRQRLESVSGRVE